MMEKRHRDKLRKRQLEFVRDLECSPVLMAVLSRDSVITGNMAEEIMAEPTRQKKASMLMAYVPKRGPKAFRTLCDALMESDQEHLCELIDPEYAEERERERAVGGRGTSYQPEEGGKEGAAGGRKETIVATPTDDLSKPFRFSNLYPENQSTPYKVEKYMDMDITEVDGKGEWLQKILQRDDIYRMGRRPRGRAVVLSNRYFMEPTLREREGAEHDIHNVMGLFQGLGFTAVKHEDKSANDIKRILDEERTHPDHNTADAFVLFLMSHGAKGQVYGMDGRGVDIYEEIAQSFDAKNCPALQGKPKMIFIQACQGKDLTHGMPQSDAGQGDEGAAPLEAAMSNLSIQDKPDSVPTFKPGVHEKSDFVMAYSTVPGYSAFRNPEKGSGFVRAVCEVFRAHAHEEHLIDLLTKVRNAVSEHQPILYKTDTSPYVQITETRETLKKKLYLLPGYNCEKDECQDDPDDKSYQPEERGREEKTITATPSEEFPKPSTLSNLYPEHQSNPDDKS